MAMRSAIAQGERLGFSAIVLCEWLRGPRVPAELSGQQALFPGADAIPFGPAEGAVAASLYRRLKKPRGRDVDIAIAATAIVHGASLWTLKTRDFSDIPGLRLYT